MQRRPAFSVFPAFAVVAIALAGCTTEEPPVAAPVAPDTPAPPLDLPPVPTAQELNDRLQRGLDPAVPVAEKATLIQGGSADPDIISKVADAARINGATVVVEDVTDLGDGTLTSNATITASGQSTPLQVTFVAEDGVWKLSKDNACGLVNLAGLQSAACA